MAMKESDIKRLLLQHQKKELHLEFFNKNASLEAINVPLPKKKQTVPFRNLDCSKPECIYDLKDLVVLYKGSSETSQKEIECEICGKRLTLQNFYLDLTLKRIFDKAWQMQEQSEGLDVESVLIMRTGQWKLIRNEEHSNPKKFKKSLSEALKPSKVENSSQLKTIVNYEKPPQLIEFTSEEFKQLLEIFKNCEDQTFEFTLLQNSLKLSRADILQLTQVETINSKIMSIFLEYLNSIQVIEKDKYKKGQNKSLFLSVEIHRYNLVHENVEYKILNKPKNKAEKIIKEYDKVMFVTNFDGRWITAIADFESEVLYITDFLSSDLSSVTRDEISQVLMIMIRAELNIQYQEIELYKGSKVKFMSDCGVYILNYLYKCMNNNLIQNIKTKFSEKELFKKQLIWLFLKMSLTQKNEIHFFTPPRIEDEIIQQSNRHPPKNYNELYQPDPANRNHYNKSANNSPLRPRMDGSSKVDNLKLKTRDSQKATRNHKSTLEEDKFPFKDQNPLNSINELRNNSLEPKARFLNTPQSLKTPFSSQLWGGPKIQHRKQESVSTSPYTPNSKLPPIHQSYSGFPEESQFFNPFTPKNHSITPLNLQRPIQITQENKTKYRFPLKLSFNQNVPEVEDDSNSSRLTTLLEEFNRQEKEDIAAKKMRSKLGSLLKLKDKEFSKVY